MNGVLKGIVELFLLNLDIFKSNFYDGRLSLIQYLFRYAQKFERDNIQTFAFEILNDLIIEEYSKLNTKTGLRILDLGQGLMIFVRSGFFEAENLEGYFQPIDKIAFIGIEKISRTKITPGFNLMMLQIAYYLVNRHMFADNSKKEDPFKEYLNILFFELQRRMDFVNMQEKGIRLMYKELFEKAKNISYLKFNANHLLNELKKYDLKNTSITEYIFNRFIPFIEIDTLLKPTGLNNKIIKNVSYSNNEIRSKKNDQIKDHLIELAIYGSVLLEWNPIINPNNYILMAFCINKINPVLSNNVNFKE